MEEGEQKKFDVTETVLLMFLAFLDDGIGLIAWLVGAFPVIGQALLFMYIGFDWLVGVFFLGWFIIKLGAFGAPAIIQAGGALIKLVGVPSRTISTGWGIWLANHPEAAAVAAVATGKPAAGEGVAAEKAAEGAVATEGGAAKALTEKPAGAAAVSGPQTKIEAGIEREGGAGRGGPETEPEIPQPEQEEKTEEKKKVSEEAFGMPKEPLEKIEESMSEFPEPEPQEEQEEEGGQAAKVVDIKKYRKSAAPEGKSDKGGDNAANIAQAA